MVSRHKLKNSEKEKSRGNAPRRAAMLNRAKDLELPVFLVGTAHVTFFFVTQIILHSVRAAEKSLGTGLATHLHPCLFSGWPISFEKS